MNHLIYNGTDFATFGAQIVESDFLKGAERDVSSFSVLGRSGDLLVDNNRFKNLTYSVTLAVKGNMATNMAAMRAFLASSSGYNRLEESDLATEFRLAEFHQSFNPAKYDHAGGTVKLAFNCKPQRFLKTGETWVPFSAAGVLTNPTGQTALPIVRIYGSGSFQIGSITVAVASNPLDYIDLDCDIMSAYCGATSAHEYITTTNHEYPVLVPGANGITVSGVTLQIQPRWFEI